MKTQEYKSLFEYYGFREGDMKDIYERGQFRLIILDTKSKIEPKTSLRKVPIRHFYGSIYFN